jgi:hypothetical protein
MHAGGVFDVQSHTRSHWMIFSGDQPVDFVTPAYAAEPLLNRPLVGPRDDGAQFLEPDDYGAPIYLRRSRMSDALRFIPNPGIADRCRAHTAQRGGADTSGRSVPAMLAARAGSPWQLEQEPPDISACPLIWAPVATLMVPSALTLSPWQAAHDFASGVPETGGCPVGGIPWHEMQESGVGSFQIATAWAPLTPLKLKFPWQVTLLQVFVAGSKAAPAAWTTGSWEKSTAKPDGAWQLAQVIPAEKTPP